MNVVLWQEDGKRFVKRNESYMVEVYHDDLKEWLETCRDADIVFDLERDSEFNEYVLDYLDKDKGWSKETLCQMMKRDDIGRTVVYYKWTKNILS